MWIPSVRGQHIGKQLIEFVQQQALARPCGRLYQHTIKTIPWPASV